MRHENEAIQSGLAMFTLSVKQFGLRCASYFDSPIPYTEAYVADLTRKVFSAFQSYGLRPDQLKKMDGDRLFRYSLAFSMFNGNVQFNCDGERLLLEISNGQNQRDAEFIAEFLNKAHECLPERSKSSHEIAAHCHCKFSADQKSEDFFGRFRSISEKVRFVRFVVESGDSKEALLPDHDRIKLSVEPSQVHEGGLFLFWQFNARGVIDEKFLQGKSQELKTLADKLDMNLSGNDLN